MKLIVGLGNPGNEYLNNRHNVGYLLIDSLSTQGNKKGYVFKKTQTFMNSSGGSVVKLVNNYSIAPSDLYILHDDLDLKLGTFKIQLGVGPKEHNGIKDIEDKLSTKEFWRIRVGVDNRDPNNRIVGEDYVLEDFTDSELKIIEAVGKKIKNELFKNL
jgi:PTH1 family peptidyl-tRNA hydrolase